jgi:hypothetical protein
LYLFKIRKVEFKRKRKGGRAEIYKGRKKEGEMVTEK